MNRTHNSSVADARERFEAVAMPLAPAIYGLALRLTRHREDAADLAQETLLRAYRTFASFVPGTNAKAWLFTILWSIVSNARDKKSRSWVTVSIEEIELRFDREFEIADYRGYFETINNAGLDWRSHDVAKALEKLPEEFRAAVLLVDVEELSYEEAAAVIACPVGTLRSRLFRGRKALAVELHAFALRMGYVDREG